MRKNLVLVALCALLMGSCVEKPNEYNIIPLPKSMDEAPGQFKISGQVSVVPSDNEAILKIARNFVDQIAKTSGKTMKLVTPGEQAPEKNVVSFKYDEKLAAEAYRLTVTPEAILIDYSTPIGAFYAVQSICQLLPPAVYGSQLAKNVSWKVPCVSIDDAPRFPYRGLHLDVSRHFMPMEFIKQYIDALAMHKMNTFHWHLTDDQGWRIEIKKYPKLTELGSKRKETVIGHNSGKYDGKPYGGFYTQEQAKEIVDYAAERFITVIPEIDLPGHMQAALTGYPELGCTGGPYEVWTQWGVSDHVLCAGNDNTLQFINDVFDELIQIFPSKYIHVGGDECPKTKWQECPKCQARVKTLGLKGDGKHSTEEQLQSFVIGSAEKFLNEHGRQIIGWDEILEGGLAPNATVMSWRGEAGGIAAAKQKHNVIMTPNGYCYLDHYQAGVAIEEDMCFGGFLPMSKIYGYNPMPAELTPEEQQYILGVQGNLWTEYMKTPERVQYQAFPRAMAIAEIDWTPLDRKDYDSFRRRLVTDYERMKAIGITPSKTFYSPIFVFKNKEYPKEMILSLDYPYATVHYTLDGTEPTAQSPVYEGPVTLNESVVVKAAGFENGKPVGDVKTRDLTK